MKIVNWGRSAFKAFFSLSREAHEVDLGKRSHSVTDSSALHHKKSYMHSTSSFQHHTTPGLIKSPVNPLNPWYGSYFSSRKNW